MKKSILYFAMLFAMTTITISCTNDSNEVEQEMEQLEGDEKDNTQAAAKTAYIDKGDVQHPDER